jgi:hypothetical protein
MPTDPGTPEDPPPPPTGPPPPSLLASARYVVDWLRASDGDWSTTEVAALAAVRARINASIEEQAAGP